jgi:hypothetical protein
LSATVLLADKRAKVCGGGFSRTRSDLRS